MFSLTRYYLTAVYCLLSGTLMAQLSASNARRDSLHCYQVAEVVIDEQISPDNGALVRHYRQQALGSIEEMIARLPGLSLVRRGNYAPEPVLRGLNPRQINLTVDGMRIFEACTGKMDPISAYVEPNNLKAIEVSAGPQGM